MMSTALTVCASAEERAFLDALENNPRRLVSTLPPAQLAAVSTLLRGY